jgi:hypothetical protein
VIEAIGGELYRTPRRCHPRRPGRPPRAHATTPARSRAALARSRPTPRTRTWSSPTGWPPRPAPPLAAAHSAPARWNSSPPPPSTSRIPKQFPVLHSAPIIQPPPPDPNQHTKHVPNRVELLRHPSSSCEPFNHAPCSPIELAAPDAGSVHAADQWRRASVPAAAESTPVLHGWGGVGWGGVR